MTAALAPPRVAVSWDALRVAGAALILFTAMGGLFRFGLTQVVWLGATAVVGLWILQRPQEAGRTVAASWPVLLLPCLAALSAAWSAARGATLVDGLQMLVTVLLALRIAAVLDTRQVMLALLLAVGTGTLLSVANLLTGALPPVWEVNGAFLGIFTQKTLVAKAVFWTAFAAVALGLMRGRPLPALLLAAGLFPLTGLALSATGEIGFAFVAMLVALAGLRRLPVAGRLLVPILLLAAVGSVAAIWVATGGALMADLLALFGKSPTLTGRTVIWSIGLDAWRDSPLGGQGYDAFWRAPRFAEAWAYVQAYVDDGLQGFHNAYVETLVGLGVVGLAALVVPTLVAWGRLLRVYVARRSLEAAVWLSLLTALMALAVIEDSFMKPRSGHLMLWVMAWASARRLLRG